jgi:hypothetical protein
MVGAGVPEGQIRGGHEHFWTDEDEDASIRVPSPQPKNWDMQSIISWCCKNWNVEGVDEQMGLYQ